MTRKGKNLIFLKLIALDGSKLTDVEGKDMSFVADETFQMSRLSITNDLWIASSFNSFIVKIPDN